MTNQAIVDREAAARIAELELRIQYMESVIAAQARDNQKLRALVHELETSIKEWRSGEDC